MDKIIRFIRGTAEQYKKAPKDKDCFYLISDDQDSSKIHLYIGDKQIGDDSDLTTAILTIPELNIIFGA